MHLRQDGGSGDGHDRHRGGAGRYIMLQLPGWVLAASAIAWLVSATTLPIWLGVVALSAFIGKDLLLYPAIRATLGPSSWSPRLIGARGVAVEPLNPSGLVRVNGELWQAEANVPSIVAGDRVIVRGARGFILLVEPSDEP
jgi:membrane protein implicated in regulation of membrane protease activity